MSKRAKEKAELIANGIMISVQGKTGRVVYNTREKSFTHYDLMCAAQKGYEQAEKDTIERVCEWLEKNATFIHPRKGVSTCIVNLSALKEAILEENNG